MYEEHTSNKLKDDNVTKVLQRSPSELAEMLFTNDPSHGHCYWTSPIAGVAPALLAFINEYNPSQLYENPEAQLDPRGPSLWMGNAGSATQAHYDVADNVIVQLFGVKRIRCYPPSAAEALHVFPDAHPRARKSQVDFDKAARENKNRTANNNNNNITHSKYPHFAHLPEPILDVVLQPGDALSIPAFWFHHVENGYQDTDPTVSLNLFALSHSMMMAQRIFQEASRVLPGREAIAVLNALSEALFEALEKDAAQFIRRSVLETRYVPLGHVHESSPGSSTRDGSTGRLSPSDQAQVADCVARILPLFESLNHLKNGIMELVLAHLLELWAVERLGAPNVADAWESVLSRTE